MRHTPGPWTVQESKTLLHVETRDSPAGDGVHVCSVPKGKAADANLIAEAPAMLEALREALDGSELCSEGIRPKPHGEHSAGCSDCQRILRARAILARIENGGGPSE